MKKNWSGERLETGIYGEVAIEHLHRYAFALDYVQGKNVLDIACGEGYGAALLAQKALSVTAMDIDNNVIVAAGKKYRIANLNFKAGNVISTGLQAGIFDIIVCFETLEHTSEHNEMLTELKRLLKSTGILIISTPDKKWYSDVPETSNPFHAKELYRSEFSELLNKYFTHKQLLDQQFFCGSMMLGQQSNVESVFYKGDFSKINRSTEVHAPYLVALASDSTLPSPGPSFFSSDNMLDAAVSQKEAELRNTITYRVGHFILSPFKWIKKRLS